MDWESVRKQFPVTERNVYIDNGSRCPLSTPVRERLEAFQRFCAEQGRDYGSWWSAADALRAKLGALINASAAQIGYGSSTTQALNLLAQGYPWQSGDNLVTANAEFPSNVYPWLGLAEKGVQVRFAEPVDGAVALEQLQAAVDDRTRVIALSHVQAATGYRLNLEEVGRFCRRRGILLCVDATQSLGAFAVDVQACRIDFLACSTYKWLMGSDGLAVYYCSEELLSRLKHAFWGWSGRTDRNEFYRYPMDYPMEARRFELGNPNFSSLQALDAAVDFHNALGGEAVAARTLELAVCFKEAVRGVNGLRIAGDYDAEHQGGLITLRLPDAPRVHAGLAKRRIITALRRDGIRISPYVCNAPQEADTLARALRDLMGGACA